MHRLYQADWLLRFYGFAVDEIVTGGEGGFLDLTLDPKLVQIRQDVKQSEAQVASKRLTGVQDLTWALINTPAFLFNH